MTIHIRCRGCTTGTPEQQARHLEEEAEKLKLTTAEAGFVRSPPRGHSDPDHKGRSCGNCSFFDAPYCMYVKGDSIKAEDCCNLQVFDDKDLDVRWAPKPVQARVFKITEIWTEIGSRM